MAGKPPGERDIQIGDNLRRLRKRAGMTQKDLGDLFGVSAAQAQKFETGKNRLSYERAQIFCARIGVSVDQLNEGVEPEGSPGFAEAPQRSYESSGPSDAAIRALVALLLSFDARARAQTIVILRRVIKELGEDDAREGP